MNVSDMSDSENRDNMIKHCILLSSSYSTGRRIVLHYAGCDDAEISKAVEKICAAYDGKRVSFSTHIIPTESVSWESVVELDPYFDDVAVIPTAEEFTELILRDRYLNGFDIARYILSKEKCTHSRIEKLAYLCYAEYLCETGDKLFRDNIRACRDGPVIDTAYRSLGLVGGDSEPAEKERLHSYGKRLELPFKSRILFAEDGQEKCYSVRRTLEKYGGCTDSQLTDSVCGAETPWDVTFREGPGLPISDRNIMERHRFESLSGR